MARAGYGGVLAEGGEQGGPFAGAVGEGQLADLPETYDGLGGSLRAQPVADGEPVEGGGLGVGPGVGRIYGGGERGEGGGDLGVAGFVAGAEPVGRVSGTDSFGVARTRAPGSAT